MNYKNEFIAVNDQNGMHIIFILLNKIEDERKLNDKDKSNFFDYFFQMNKMIWYDVDFWFEGIFV